MPSRPVTLYANPKIVYYVAGGILLLALAAVAFRGLTPTNGGTTKQASIDKAAEDPWPPASKDLERETDAANCRRVLDQLTSELSAHHEFGTLPGLSAEEEKALKERFAGFNEEDAKDLRSTAFTKLDPHHLAECFYFRDAARALDVADRPPTDRAAAAFAFVCRQVYLNRWLVRLDANRVQPMPPVPPSYVLRRGWGTGLERALVFLSLVRQLGLDGCLVGPPGSESKPGLSAPAGKAESIESLTGPFWAVGVRIGADLHLFEPWRGEAFPGTLAQLKANPKLLDPWVEDKKGWGVTPADVAAAEVYLAVPVSTLAPRMKVLGEKFTGASAVSPYVDPAAVAAEFVKAKATPTAPKWWSPPVNVDPTDLLHGMATFQPSDDGGRGGPVGLIGRFHESLLPTALFAPAPELKSNEAALVVLAGMKAVYKSMYLTPPTPLERIQRGSYFEVSSALTEKERGFARAVTQFRGAPQLPKDTKELVDAWNAAYGKLQKARVERDPAGESEARAEIEAIWAKPTLSGVLVERGLAEPAEAEATYLLALCKHEAAVRADGRADRAAAAARAAGADSQADPGRVKAIRDQATKARADAVGAWKEARTWWMQYQTVKKAQEVEYPGRLDHAAKLTAEAAAKVSGG
jgi:hypothetical protein